MEGLIVSFQIALIAAVVRLFFDNRALYNAEVRCQRQLASVSTELKLSRDQREDYHQQNLALLVKIERAVCGLPKGDDNGGGNRDFA